MGRRPYLWYAAWAAFSVILGVLYVKLPLYIDHRWFDYLGSVLLEGGRPYADAGDQNFPGIFFLHALALGLFGYHTWSFRLLDYLMLLGFVLIMARTLASRQGTIQALIFIPLYQLLYVTAGFAISGQRDLFAAHLDLVAGALLLRRIGGGNRAWLVPAGLAVFMAALLKPTFVIFAPCLPLIDLVARRRSGRPPSLVAADQAVWALSAGTAAAAMLLIGWQLDILGAWYEWAIAFNYEVYSAFRLPPTALFLRASHVFLTYWPVYAAVALVGGLRWWSTGDRPLLVLLLASAATTTASVILQGKLYDYHLAASLPVLALLMSEALAWAYRSLTSARPGRVREAWPVALAALMLLVTTMAVGKKVVGTYRIPIAWQLGRIGDEEYLEAYNLDGVPEVVAFVSEHTTPEETVWAFADDIIDINHLARRKPSSRFWNPYHFFNALAPFSGAGRWQAEVADMIRNRPPKMIIMCVSEEAPHLYQYPPPGNPSPIVGIFNEALASRYQRVKTIKEFEIYERVR